MKLTILMYHKVAEPTAHTRHRANYVRPKQFEAQMNALSEWGYTSIPFDQWLDNRRARAVLPAKPVIITFDDGYRCFESTAWPILRARGMHAMVFLVAGQIGGTNAWDSDEVQEPLLDADRILALQRDGVRFGSHGYSHVPLARVPPDHAFGEMVRSRTALEELLGRPVDVLSYPYSNQSAAVRTLAARAGYRACVRGKGRMNFAHTDLFGLRRIKFDSTMSLADVRRTLFRARWLR